jgi:predicted phage terminase large subunit-like protein
MLLPHNLGPCLLHNEWQYPSHFQKFEEVALKLIYGDLNKVLVNVSVRHGKSTYWSTLLPAWYLLTHPNDKVIVITYSGELSAEFTGKVRDIIQEYGPALTGVKLDPRYRARNFCKLAPPYFGELRSAAPNSKLAGTGADLLIIDDANRDIEEIANPVRREKLYQWFMSEAFSRLSPTGKCCCIQSTRHPDDLPGRLLRSNEELPPEQHWKQIRFPAIDDNNKPLWPERYSLDKLNQIKKEYEVSGFNYLWESLFQQNPIAFESLEWPLDYMPNYYSNTPDERIRFRLMALDPSMGRPDHSGDFPALIYVIITTDGHVYIEDASMTIAPIDQIEDLAVMWHNKYTPDAFIIETNGFQELVSANIQRKCPTAPIYKHDSRENKEVRIRMGLTPILAQHRLHLKDIPANKIIWQQLREFPSGLHDDGPDVINLACDLCNKLLDKHK